jgi:cytochrome oxidase assembly protein ShyY1
MQEVEIGELYLADFLYRSDAVFAENNWPKRIGRMNIAGLSQELGVDVLSVMVRLRENSPSALTVDWPVVNIAPEKNIAYAIQWFAMAVALLVCYIALSFRRKEALENKVIN